MSVKRNVTVPDGRSFIAHLAVGIRLRARTSSWLAAAVGRGRPSYTIDWPGELRSGVRRPEILGWLRLPLAGFDCVEIGIDDYDQAARWHDELRSRGVAGRSVDLLVCAVASRAQVPIFTTDHDFQRYAENLLVRLHDPG